MDTLSRIGIWINRTILLAVSVLFTFIAYRNLVNPVESAIVVNISLRSSSAITVARVSLGAFPLVLAILVASSIFSLRQQRRGIITVVIMVSVVTAARIFGLAMDGVTPHNLDLLHREEVILGLSLVGLTLE